MGRKVENPDLYAQLSVDWQAKADFQEDKPCTADTQVKTPQDHHIAAPNPCAQPNAYDDPTILAEADQNRSPAQPHSAQPHSAQSEMPVSSDLPSEEFQARGPHVLHHLPRAQYMLDARATPQLSTPAQLDPWIGQIAFLQFDMEAQAGQYGLLCNDVHYISAIRNSNHINQPDQPGFAVGDVTVIFGAQAKATPITYNGQFEMASIALRPGAIRSLFNVDEGELMDTIHLPSESAFGADELADLSNFDGPPDAWLDWIVAKFTDYIDRRAPEPPSQLSRDFEAASFRDPNQSIGDFAEQQGMSLRSLQRAIKREFGMTPKQVMRRARIQDLAMQIYEADGANNACSNTGLNEDAFLRFFDQSHMIREFTNFFELTPGEFYREQQGLLGLSLELRRMRKDDALGLKKRKLK